MEEFIRKYRKFIFVRRLFYIVCFGIMAVAFLGGLAGVVICSVKNDFSKFSLCMVIALVVPIVLWILFLISIARGKEKKRAVLDKELEESSLTADEVMKLGETVKLNLFNVAATKRCRELGLDEVPEWVVRDGVLPTENDIHVKKED